MSEEDANKTGHVELFVPKTEISIWNSLIGLVIFIGLVLISPIFGTKLSQLLNRFGLLAQVLGLVSLVPEYFKEKLKGWNMQLAEWATSLEERRESIYYLKILWTESISKDERQRHIQNAHILIQIIAGLAAGTILLFSNYQAISIHPIILGVLKLYEFVFMLWLTLKIAKKIFERFKKSLPNSINKIFYSFDVYLFLPVYSMVSTYYSFASYLLNLGINVKNTGIEDLLKKVAVPFISVGTVAEFWASWLQ